ncbi:hypothetical protein OXX79_002364 [Metschnikowia pulcherrima]
MVSATQIEQVVESLFPSDQIHASNPTPDMSRSIYPEELLHATKNGNKYYVALQAYTRSFIGEENGSQHHTSIVQFGQSKLSAQSRQKVLFWDETGHENVARLHRESTESQTERGFSSRGNQAASSLFAWSSGDKYIAARKRELLKKHVDIQAGKDKVVPENPLKTVAKTPKSNLGLRLHGIVERESNRFIQDRIELIKAHHLEQATKKIDERKRRDHEMHLRRVQLKEEKYEKAIKQAIALQNTKRNSGFFGALFGHKSISNSFTLQIPDGDVPVVMESSPLSLPKSRSVTPVPDKEIPSLLPRTLTPEKKPHQNDSVRPGTSHETGSKNSVKPEQSSSSSARSSGEFEDFQYSTDKSAYTGVETTLGPNLSERGLNGEERVGHSQKERPCLNGLSLNGETIEPRKTKTGSEDTSDLLSL